MRRGDVSNHYAESLIDWRHSPVSASVALVAAHMSFPALMFGIYDPGNPDSWRVAGPDNGATANYALSSLEPAWR